MFALRSQIANYVARRQVEQRAGVVVAASAKVNWRGIRHRPPGRLEIGEGSIFEGAIAADRGEACVIIGRNTFIGNSTIVTAERVDIGDDVLISWGCTIVDHDSHALEWAGRQNDVRDHYRGVKDWSQVNVRPVVIGNKVWIGFNVTILKGVTVGEGAVIGAGSVVTRDVAPYSVAAGNPARSIRSLRENSI